jgi:hypothetical protein
VALEDGHGRAGNGICRDDTQQDVAADAEPPLDKDSQIQENNGHFRQANGKLVEDLRNVKPLFQEKICELPTIEPKPKPKPKPELRVRVVP